MATTERALARAIRRVGRVWWRSSCNRVGNRNAAFRHSMTDFFPSNSVKPGIFVAVVGIEGQSTAFCGLTLETTVPMPVKRKEKRRMLKQARAEQTGELAPLSTPRTTRQLHLVQPHRPRLLLVCDSALETAKLQSALKLGAVEIVSVSQIEELSRLAGQECTLAVIDVAPAKLVEVLKTIRASESLAGLPVFVEASKIISATDLAGVLPQYRAMPCGYADLVTLVRQRLAPAK